MATLLLTPDEAEAVTAICETLRQEAQWAALSADQLLNRWEEIVTHVERGYSWLLAEYTNDLGVRDMLEYLLTNVPLSAQVKLLRVLRPLDMRFQQATQATAELLDEDEDVGFWWHRVPQRLAPYAEIYDIAWRGWARYYPATAQPLAPAPAA